MPLLPGESAGPAHGPGTFVKTPFKRVRKFRPRRKRTPETVIANFHLPPALREWLDEQARAQQISFSALMRRLAEYYRSVCVNRQAQLADEIIKIFPPGTNGIAKPFAMSSDAFRERPW
jgi:hypothetical protein